MVARDEQIRKDIVGVLKQNVLFHEHDIEVGVINGNVSLSGEVPTFAARKAAYEAALYTPGVVNIHDEIEVLYQFTPADPNNRPG
jgi:osmotically-inducible protein OsmY